MLSFSLRFRAQQDTWLSIRCRLRCFAAFPPLSAFITATPISSDADARAAPPIAPVFAAAAMLMSLKMPPARGSCQSRCRLMPRARFRLIRKMPLSAGSACTPLRQPATRCFQTRSAPRLTQPSARDTDMAFAMYCLISASRRACLPADRYFYISSQLSLAAFISWRFAASHDATISLSHAKAIFPGCRKAFRYFQLLLRFSCDFLFFFFFSICQLITPDFRQSFHDAFCRVSRFCFFCKLMSCCHASR